MPLYDSDMAEQPTEQDQAVLFEGGERQIRSAAEEAAPGGAVRVQWIDRQQMRMAMIDVEQLIAEDHAARASFWPCATRTGRYRNVPRANDSLVARGPRRIVAETHGFC